MARAVLHWGKPSFVCAWFRLCFALRGAERCASHLIPARLQPSAVALSEVQDLRLSSQAASLYTHKHTHKVKQYFQKPALAKKGQSCFYKNLHPGFFSFWNAAIEIYTAMATSPLTSCLWQRKTSSLFLVLCYTSSLMGLKILLKKYKGICDSLVSKLHFRWFHTLLFSSSSPHNSYPSHRKVSGSDFSHSTCTSPRSPAKETLPLRCLISGWLKEKFRTWENLAETEYQSESTERQSKKWENGWKARDLCLREWIRDRRGDLNSSRPRHDLINV